MKNIKITGLTIKPFAGRPFLLFLFLAIEIFIVLFFITDYRKYNNLHREQLFRAFEAGYRGATTSYDHSIQVIFNDEVNKPEVLKLIALALDDEKKKDACRNELYRLMLPFYESQKTIGILQFHFHLKDGTSFLRMHAPEKYGDNLFSRTAVYEVNKELKPVKGYEVGYFADGYRFLYPLFYNGRHVGSVEFGISTEGIINYLNHIYPAHYLFMINRTIVDNMTYADWKKRNYRESGLSENFMIGQKTAGDTIVASINQKLGNKVRDRLAGMGQFVEQKTVDGKDYLITFLPVWDVKGDAAAYFVQYINDSSLVHQSRITIIDITLFTLLLAAIFYSIDNIQYKRRDLQKNLELLSENEQKIFDTMEFNKSILKTSSIGILTYNAAGQCVFANEAAAKIVGANVDALLSQNFHQVQSWQKNGMYEAALRALNTDSEQQAEAHVLTTFGKDLWLSLRFSSFHSKGEKHLLLFTYDFTKRKLVEQNQERLVAMLDATPGFVGFADAKDTHILYINPTGRKMVGVQAQDDVTQLKIADVHPEWTNKLFRDEIIPTAIRDGIWTGECAFLNRDGREIPAMMALLSHKSPSGEVDRFSTVSIDITERKKDEEKIKKALKEKETLLREIHHRVKNNLQVITSLLNLQARKIEDPNFRKPFEESEQRIKAMALVHERLYQIENLSDINFSGYIHDIIAELKIVYSIDGRKVAINTNVADIVLGIDSAVPCGLIINELITNCFKYAFPEGRSGEVDIDFTKEGNTYNLTIKDNGIGFPAGFDHRQTTTLGMQLVNVLTRQLMGTFQIRSDGGTEACITFTRKERIDGKEKNIDS